MAGIRSFRELETYQLARERAQAIFLLTRSFSAEEKYSLTDQIRRSSRAVNAMLAESWARRRYIAVFVNKLNEAQAEAMETQAWLDHALDCKYIQPDQHREHDREWQRVGAMLNRMIDRAEDFCGKSTRG